MFDYQYGTSTKKFKQEVEKMKPKLSIRPQGMSKLYSLILKFSHGLEVVNVSTVSKQWYVASWNSTLWQEICLSLGESDRIEMLLELAESKTRTYERRSKKQDLSDLIPEAEVREALKWKLVYGQLLYNTCSGCKIQENKLRFLPILQKSLCYSCAKLPAYSMITLENAEIDYGITRKHINEHQIEGLRIPDPDHKGNYIFVYYVADISRLKELIENLKKEDSANRTELHERRRTEMIYALKKEGIDDNFISACLDTEGSLAYNYIVGKSRMPVSRIAKKMLSRYEKWRENEQEDEVLPEPETILPLKRPKFHLTAEDKTSRKLELVDRLVLMGVNTDDIGLDDPESLSNAYIEGRTKEDLGPVAGAIWREHKPIFNGTPFRKIPLYMNQNPPPESSSESD